MDLFVVRINTAFVDGGMCVSRYDEFFIASSCSCRNSVGGFAVGFACGDFVCEFFAN